VCLKKRVEGECRVGGELSECSGPVGLVSHVVSIPAAAVPAASVAAAASAAPAAAVAVLAGQELLDDHGQREEERDFGDDQGLLGQEEESLDLEQHQHGELHHATHHHHHAHHLLHLAAT